MRVRFLFVAVIALLGFLYFYIFMKSKSIESASIVSLCKKNDRIEVNLIDTFHYIQSYELQKKKDTIFLEVYLTTIGNFMNKEKSLKFYIKNDADYIKIKKRVIKTADIHICQ